MIEFAGMHETLLDDIGVGAGSLYMGSCQSRQAASNDVRRRSAITVKKARLKSAGVWLGRG
jgi:hypothetical protein